MNGQKSLLIKLAETLEQHRSEQQEMPTQQQRPSPSKLSRLVRWFLPNGGTLLMVLLLIATQSLWAAPFRAPSATSTSTISYQGRLADAGGNPLSDNYNMEFRIYDVPDGGTPLWQEYWTGSNSVEVNDGLFNVMLGSIDTTLAGAIDGHDELYLGITVGTDGEMSPRVQLGSVPFSMQAMTVADGSVTTDKLADGSVTTDKLADGSMTTAKIADGAITSRQLAPSWYEDSNPSTISTTSTDPVPTDVSVTFSCETDCTALILHRSLVYHSNTNGRVDVNVLVDGNIEFRELGVVNVAHPGPPAASVFHAVEGFDFVNLPAGSHTVEVEFRCYTPGTCYYYGDSNRQWEHLNVLLFAQP